MGISDVVSVTFLLPHPDTLVELELLGDTHGEPARPHPTSRPGRGRDKALRWTSDVPFILTRIFLGPTPVRTTNEQEHLSRHQ